MRRKVTAFACLLLAAFAAPAAAQSQIGAEPFQRVTHISSGLVWDIVNGGERNGMIHLVPAGNYSGQNWSFSRERGRWKGRTEFTGGGNCFDVVNGGRFDGYLRMAPCGNYSGQFIHVRNAGSNRYIVETDFTGPQRCAAPDPEGYLFMKPCNKRTDQLYQFSRF